MFLEITETKSADGTVSRTVRLGWGFYLTVALALWLLTAAAL